MKQKVIVIGNSFATRLGVVRSVGEIGCEVTVIDIAYYKTSNPSKPIDCYSKYVNQVIFFDRKYGREGLVQLLLEKCADKNQKPIIIPTSDFTAVAIDNEVIRKHFLVPYINNAVGSIEYWMNKANQKTIALQAGLNVAGSTIVEKKADSFVIPETVKYPCFTKPLASIGGGKQCLKRCDNKLDLQGVLKLAVSCGINKLLVEDYLDIDEEYAVLGFSDANEVVIPGVIKFVKGCQSHKGVAMIGEVLPIDGFKEIVDKFARFISSIGFVGLFDIDFFKCRGDFYFGELNIRIGASGTVINKMGVNLPVMFVKSILGKEIGDSKREISTSAIFVNERMCIDDWLSGILSTNKLHHIINSATILFIKDNEDSSPYEVLAKEIRLNTFNYKRIIKRTLNILK